MIRDQGVVCFMRDAFNLDLKINMECLNRIDDSKLLLGSDTSSEKLAVADIAAKAITLLNIIDMDFSGEDLSDICIPNAVLSQGNFERVNFTNANLTRVNFSSAWLKDANLKNAKMADIQFGEWPYHNFNSSILSISCSQNANVVAVGFEYYISIFEIDSKSGKILEVKKIQTPDQLENCELNADGDKLLVHSPKNSSFTVWDVSSSTSILKESIPQGLKGVSSFSPNGKQIASIVEENIIYIWETATGVCTHTFRGHESCFIHCKFSADGKQILSGSDDKKLCIWDIESSLSTHKDTTDKRNQKGLSLLNANIEGATGLSGNNIMLLFQRGAYGFSEGAAKIFANNIRDIIGDQDENGGELDFTNKNLNAESIRGMARFTNWETLRILHLSRNQIGEKKCNRSWRKHQLGKPQRILLG